MMRQTMTGTAMLIISTATLCAQIPGVLFDTNQTASSPRDSEPRGFAKAGNNLLFLATTDALGTELWRMDVVNRHVSLVADIATGSASSSPTGLTTFGPYVYFSADDGVHGRELWRSDGTTAGTTMVIDMITGDSNPRNLTVVGGKLFFSAFTPLGTELVVSNGTAAGTTILDLTPGGNSLIGAMTPIGNELWFSNTDSTFGIEPWRTDGTIAGTVMIGDLTPGAGSSFVSPFFELGNGAAFVAAGSIWHSDGTSTGTIALAPSSARLAKLGSRVFFFGGGAIWSTDGTVANTQSEFSFTLPPFSNLNTFDAFGSHLVLGVQGIGASATWLSDGTAAGTELLTTTGIGNYRVYDGTHLYFGSEELWRTDGTVAGTTLVADVWPGATPSLPRDLFALATGDIVFSADSQVGRELWQSNGTRAGTTMVANIADETGATNNGDVRNCVDAAGYTFFTAQDGANTVLWRTDGTAQGTMPVVPAGPMQPTSVQRLRSAGTKVFFIGRTPATGNEVWVTDGTAAGTHVIDTYLGAEDSNPSFMTVAADWLYFLSYNPAGSRSLWRTDGTPSGTFAISFQVSIGTIGWMEPLGRGLVFQFDAFSQQQGAEPWFTSGQLGGTVQLMDYAPGLPGSAPESLTTLGDRCFFTAKPSPGYNNRLMVTDGTPAGTLDFLAGVANAPTHYDRLIRVRDRLFFLATTVDGQELWTSDGTVAGTHQVLDANPGASGINFVEATAFGDLLLYRVIGNNLAGLWRSDGTAAGTFAISNGSIGAQHLTATGDRFAWFAGFDEAHGYELWRTDGTIAGTSLYADLLPGDRSSNPANFVLSRGRLLFSAEHELLGTELWSMDLTATSQDVGYGCTPTTTIAPELWSNDPVLGATTTMHIHYGPLPGISVMLLSNHTSTTFPLGTGACDYFVDANLAILSAEVMSNGMSNHTLSIPNNPALNQQLFRAQAITLPISGLLGAELSNALTLSLGF
jgi:ELWxxDGT repeat protein